MGNSCCHNYNIRYEMLWQWCPQLFYREQSMSELDLAEVHCSCNCHLLIYPHSSHWWDSMEHITIILFIFIPFCTPSYISIVTLAPSLFLHKWWEDWKGSIVVIHNQPSWHWPSCLSHTDIIRQGLPASHHDTQDNRTENCEAVAWIECDTNT